MPLDYDIDHGIYKTGNRLFGQMKANSTFLDLMEGNTVGGGTPKINFKITILF